LYLHLRCCFHGDNSYWYNREGRRQWGVEPSLTLASVKPIGDIRRVFLIGALTTLCCSILVTGQDLDEEKLSSIDTEHDLREKKVFVWLNFNQMSPAFFSVIPI